MGGEEWAISPIDFEPLSKNYIMLFSHCKENADFSNLNVMAISGGGWQVVCLQNICWAEGIFSKAPTFWAFDRIGKLYLVSFWVMKSFVVLCERTFLWGSWFPAGSLKLRFSFTRKTQDF